MKARWRDRFCPPDVIELLNEWSELDEWESQWDDPGDWNDDEAEIYSFVNQDVGSK